MEAEVPQLFLEDFRAGAKFAGTSRKITEADVDIICFGRKRPFWPVQSARYQSCKVVPIKPHWFLSQLMEKSYG